MTEIVADHRTAYGRSVYCFWRRVCIIGSLSRNSNMPKAPSLDEVGAFG